MAGEPVGKRTWIALVSAIVLAVSLFALWPHARKQDDGVALAQNLSRIRRAIALYHQRNDHGPATLDELVQGGQLSYVPLDPITNAKNWHLDTEETVRSNDFSGNGPSGNTTFIVDVHSSAPGKDANGKAFSEY